MIDKDFGDVGIVEYGLLEFFLIFILGCSDGNICFFLFFDIGRVNYFYKFFEVIMIVRFLKKKN